MIYGILSKDSPIPLYHQLKTILLNQIETGALKPDDRLPTEEELARHCGISKITVRQALKELATKGILRREQGRGTFVAKPKLQQGPRELTSFTEEMRRHGALASSRVLEVSTVPAETDEAERLGVAEGTQLVKLKRLRFADREPMGVQTAYLVAALVPGLEAQELATNSLYEILANRYGLAPRTARETHYAVSAGREEAALLGLPAGAPVLAAERVTYLSTGQPLELVYSAMRGDRYKIVLDLVSPA